MVVAGGKDGGIDNPHPPSLGLNGLLGRQPVTVANRRRAAPFDPVGFERSRHLH